MLVRRKRFSLIFRIRRRKHKVNGLRYAPAASSQRLRRSMWRTVGEYAAGMGLQFVERQ
jgi:hypothetical protein